MTRRGAAGHGGRRGIPALLGIGVAAACGWAAGRASTAPERAALRYRLTHDELTTTLLNRTGLREAAAAVAARPVPGPAAVLLIDLDRFKAVNDRHGHHVGDAVLLAVAERLHRLQLLTGGAAARLGGDEFAVLLPLDHPAAVLDGARLAAAVTAALTAPYRIGSADADPLRLCIGASVGAAGTPNFTTASLRRLLRDADTAMYAVKHRRDRAQGSAGAGAGTGAGAAAPADPVTPPPGSTVRPGAHRRLPEVAHRAGTPTSRRTGTAPSGAWAEPHPTVKEHRTAMTTSAPPAPTRAAADRAAGEPDGDRRGGLCSGHGLPPAG